VNASCGARAAGELVVQSVDSGTLVALAVRQLERHDLGSDPVLPHLGAGQGVAELLGRESPKRTSKHVAKLTVANRVDDSSHDGVTSAGSSRFDEAQE
jgi:hypothetical protein